MSDIATLSLDDGLLALRSELVYTKARLAADTGAATHAAAVQALLDRWTTVFTGQLAAWDAEDDAEAGVASANDALDDETRGFLKDLQHLFPKGHPTVARFVGSDTVTSIVRLGLQSQLARLAGWVDSIRTLAGAAGTHADPLAAALARGQAALDARVRANAARADFRSTTAEHFVDDVNATRLSLFGALLGYGAEHGKAPDWAHRFFRTRVGGRRRATGGDTASAG